MQKYHSKWSEKRTRTPRPVPRAEKFLSRTRNRCFWLEKLFLWVGRDMNYVCYRHPHSVAPWFLLKMAKESALTATSYPAMVNGVDGGGAKNNVIFLFYEKQTLNFASSSSRFATWLILLPMLKCVLYFHPCFHVFFTSFQCRKCIHFYFFNPLFVSVLAL